VRTEGFEGAMLSTLVIASMVTAALSISITSVSAAHTPTVSIDKDMVKAGTMVFTITVQNAGPAAIDNVRIFLPSGFSNFAPTKKVPKDNIVRTDVSDDNLIILQAGTFVQLATSEIVELAENTDVIRLKDTWIWIPAWGENAQLKENGLLEVRQDTNTGDNLAIGDNVGPVLDKQLTLTTDNRVRVVADTQVVWVSGNTVKLLENALVEVVVDDNASDYVSGDNVALEVEKTVTLQDNRVRTVNLVNVKRGGVTSTNIDAGVSIELLSSGDNNVVLPVDTKVKFLSDVTVTLPENTDVIRPANNRLELISPAENEPINWNQSVAASSTAPPGTYVEWENNVGIASGASLAFPFAVTTPPAGGDYTIYVKTTDTTGLSAQKEITLTIDNASPTVIIAASPSWVKDNVEVTITLTASESLAKLENVMVAENNAQENTQIVMTPNADNTVWTGAYTTGDNSKRDGTAKIYVIGSQFEDLVGNKGSGVFENTFTIDRLKPLKPNIDAITGFPTSSPTTPTLIATNIGSWTIEGVAQDNFLGGTVNMENGTVKVRVGTTVHDVTTTATGYFSKSITLTEGTQEVGIQYVDLAGNVGPENAENVTYDATAPSISITSPADGATIVDNTPLIRLTIADATLGVENATPYNFADNSGYTVQLRRDDNVVLATLIPKTVPTVDPFKSFTFENQWPTELSENTYNIFVQAGDNLQKDNTHFRFMVQALTRDPIYIVGNDNFIPANGVVGGSGTENDPYIIENWDISAGSAIGIEIWNTTAYFIIRNCYVHDSGKYYDGIYFWNVANGEIDNVTCVSNDGQAIYFNSSSNNNITNCTVKNNSGSGIWLDNYSNNNVISNCTAENNDPGIWLTDNSDNNVIENCATNNCGIQFDYSSYNDIKNCTVENSRHGIYLTYSNNNIISNCTVKNNDDSITLRFSSGNNIKNCTIENNSDGIFLSEDSYLNIIENCICENNRAYGIRLYYGSSYNRIYHNNIINNTNQADDDSSSYWDNGYPSGGNYWSDYTGADNYRGGNQDIPGSDGIGDTPYLIPGGINLDRYPLMNPFVPEAIPPEEVPQIPIEWTRQFGTSASDSAWGVAIDTSGNVYVAGRTSGALPGQSSAGESDAFVRKYDGSGNELWTSQFGSSTSDYAYGVAVDISGNVYVVGNTWGALLGQSSSGNLDGFVAKYRG